MTLTLAEFGVCYREGRYCASLPPSPSHCSEGGCWGVCVCMYVCSGGNVHLHGVACDSLVYRGVPGWGGCTGAVCGCTGGEKGKRR